MILELIITHVGIIIDKFMEAVSYENKGIIQAKLIEFCKEICGYREQQWITSVIENKLPDCLNFDKACALNFEDGKLLALRYYKNEFGEVYLENPEELPQSLGITGKCLMDRKTIISNFAKSDRMFNSQIDNVLRLPRIDNIMVVTLLVDHNKRIKVTKYKTKGECMELIGVLQLINYKEYDISKVNMVIYMR